MSNNNMIHNFIYIPGGCAGAADSRWLTPRSPSSMILPTMATWDSMYPTTQAPPHAGTQQLPVLNGPQMPPTSQGPGPGPGVGPGVGPVQGPGSQQMVHSPMPMSVPPTNGVAGMNPGSVGSMGQQQTTMGQTMPQQPTGPGRPVMSPAGMQPSGG